MISAVLTRYWSSEKKAPRRQLIYPVPSSAPGLAPSYPVGRQDWSFCELADVPKRRPAKKD
jgi:hypothetical protein